MQDDREFWKPVEGYPSYEISNKGNVVHIKNGTVKYLKGTINQFGYRSIIFNDPSTKRGQKTYSIAKLVLQHFSEYDSEKIIKFKDSNKANFSKDNLEQVSFHDYVWSSIRKSNLNRPRIVTLEQQEIIKKSVKDGMTNDNIIRSLRKDYINAEQSKSIYNLYTRYIKKFKIELSDEVIKAEQSVISYDKFFKRATKITKEEFNKIYSNLISGKTCRETVEDILKINLDNIKVSNKKATRIKNTYYKLERKLKELTK